jgi:Sulfotransferase domain
MYACREYFQAQRVSWSDGEYAQHLRRWLKDVRRSQLFILSMQTLLRNTTDTMQRLQHFLGLEQGWGDNVVLPHDNDSAHLNALLDCATYDGKIATEFFF